MQLASVTSEIYVPDGLDIDEAVGKTTHLCVSAHQDDIEIMAFHGVLECFGSSDKHFMGVTVTNGSGSPRDDVYADYTDEQMMAVRRLEQKKAAFVGEYCAHAFLDYPSSAVKEPPSPQPSPAIGGEGGGATSWNLISDLKTILLAARPNVIYTHNLADKHDTHVAVTLRLIRAIRELPKDTRPERLLGCEVWRDLDWLNDEDKVVLNVEAHENLAASLLGVFDSQICGGKRYDLATIGRRRANATYFASHGVDESNALTFAIDLTPLITDDKLDPNEYIRSYIDRFAAEVTSRIAKMRSLEH